MYKNVYMYLFFKKFLVYLKVKKTFIEFCKQMLTSKLEKNLIILE